MVRFAVLYFKKENIKIKINPLNKDKITYRQWFIIRIPTIPLSQIYIYREIYLNNGRKIRSGNGEGEQDSIVIIVIIVIYAEREKQERKTYMEPRYKPL